MLEYKSCLYVCYADHITKNPQDVGCNLWKIIVPRRLSSLSKERYPVDNKLRVVVWSFHGISLFIYYRYYQIAALSNIGWQPNRNRGNDFRSNYFRGGAYVGNWKHTYLFTYIHIKMIYFYLNDISYPALPSCIWPEHPFCFISLFLAFFLSSGHCFCFQWFQHVTLPLCTFGVWLKSHLLLEHQIWQSESLPSILCQ